MKTYNFIVLLSLILLFTELLAGQSTQISIQKNSLQMNFQPENHLVLIENTIFVQAAKKTKNLSFFLNKKAVISKISWQGKDVKFQLLPEFDFSKYFNQADSVSLSEYKWAGELTLFFDKPFRNGQLKINYSLTASDSVDKAAFSREYIAYEVDGFIGQKGIFFSPAYFWYPTLPENLSHFDIRITTPENLLIVTEGDLVENRLENGQRTMDWKINYPSSGLYVVGSNYITNEKKYKNIAVQTYFFPESQELSESYLSACVQYLEMYEKLIGPYPFSKFAVVENFFPTGYGMPSYTLLGSQVIRLPFIIQTSLGHEIAHNWWGNSVYVDYESGNWCEGLTTYYADHYYKQNKSSAEARDYRRDLNRDFTVYVKDDKDFPLSRFRERTESSSRAVGYGKSAMVFHQLKQIIGDSLFFKSFQKFYHDYKFKEASWEDIENTVENIISKDLSWFFKQWTKRKGAPEIELQGIIREGNILSFTLKQQQPEIYRLFIPVEIHLQNNSRHITSLWLEKSEQRYSLQLNSLPTQLIIDPEFDLFRKLSKTEIPPTLAEVFAQDSAWIILPDLADNEKTETYKQLAQSMSQGEGRLIMRTVQEATSVNWNEKSLYVLGDPHENSIYQKLALENEKEFTLHNHTISLDGRPVPAPDEVVILTARQVVSDHTICMILVGANKKIGRIGSLLSHYGKYSYLVFRDGKNSAKGNYSSSRSPLQYSFE